MYDSLDDIRDQVFQSGNILTITVEEIRNAYKGKRMGTHVATNISKKLSTMGLAHYPQEFPHSQKAWVRIYRQGTPMAELLNAALHPSMETDDVLRAAAAGDAETILNEIRELVCA